MSKEVYIHIDSTGNKRYYADSAMAIPHRADGPAIESTNGYRSWWMHGQRHRVDGPAIEFPNGGKSWYLNGVVYTAEEFKSITNPQPVELTLDQIAAKFNIDVKNLKIVK